MMDKARQQTDKMLKALERRVSAVYASDPSLLRVEKEYRNYMGMVYKLTEADYRAFQNADGIEDRKRLKEVYMGKIEALTTRNKRYKDIIHRFTDVMAQVNQKALDIVNAEMAEIYRINYNQVAIDCKSEGIEVDGE